MLHSVKKGAFTLIELLVVITIIGILATGATTVYTSQIQKARDTTRVNDIKALQGGVEQFYQDIGSYPAAGASFSGVTIYVPRLPSDPKSSQAGGSAFDYLYNVSADANTIPNQEYELSTTFEQTGNTTTKSANDGGNDPLRLEVGISLSDTQQNTIRSGAIPATLLKYVCVNATTGTTAVPCAAAAPMLIRN